MNATISPSFRDIANELVEYRELRAHFPQIIKELEAWREACSIHLLEPDDVIKERQDQIARLMVRLVWFVQDHPIASEERSGHAV